MLAPGPARAGFVEPLALLSYSPDITVVLDGTTIAPGDVADDDLVHPPALVDVGPVPPGANLTSYHRTADGDHLLTFDVTVILGGLTIEPSDIVRTDGASYSFYFSGVANGITPGTAIDAVATMGDDLLLSFDVDVSLNGLTIDDADVVRFDGVDFSLFFDSKAAGVPQELDLDALHVLDSGRILVSFDGSGTVGGVSFDDEDVLAYDFALDAWALVYDGSMASPEWSGADLDVIYAQPVVPTPTATEPPTDTATPGVTSTPTDTVAVPATFTAPPVATESATASPTPLHSATATAISTGSTTASATATTSPHATFSATASPSPTASATATPDAGASPTPTGPSTPTLAPSPTATPGGPTDTPTQTPPAPTPTATATTPAPGCAGDCNGSGEVTIDELIRGVNIALGNLAVTECPAFDANGNGTVSIDELVRAVSNALNGCA